MTNDSSGAGADGTIEVPISVSLRGAKEGEREPALGAYAFSGGGELVSYAALEADRGRLSIPRSERAQAIRVLVGPEVDEQERSNLGELLRRGYQEIHLRSASGEKLPPIELVIDRPIWRCWLEFCVVTGTLLDRVMRDGVPIDLPVCDATVEIWQVDRIELIIPRLPNEIIARLAGLIAKPPPIPDPVDGGGFPGPAPGPDPRPFLALSAFGGAPSTSPPAGSADDSVALASALHALADSSRVRSAAISGNAETLRDALISEAELVRPLLCWWFPGWVTKQVIGQATTDTCGHFSATVWKGCEALNLYFTASQWWFGGFDPYPLQILDPTPVSCHTWWNFTCGSEITLYATSPITRTCAPCPPVIAEPRWVLAMAIGNTPISTINGLSSVSPGDGSNNGLTTGGAPFGGTMGLRLEFDDALAAIGVQYYQVAWRTAGSTAAPQPLVGDVHRHYAYDVGGNLVVVPYTLGPQTVGTTWPLYEIPPALPPEGQWSYPDVTQDLNNATFPSVSFVPAPASGLIELHVNLFDTAGNPVDISTEGVHYSVPTSTDFSGTIYTEDAAADGLVDGSTLVLPLYIDNNPCTAAIDAPTLDGSAASDNCGVMRYGNAATDQVTIGYHAHQPEGFATYSFGLVRGANGLTPPSQSGAIGAGDFSDTESVASLMGSCTIAGFAENLSVWAMAIDGWSRLSQYDAYAVRAFALAPNELS
jgi:hypothetical protein